VGEGGNTGLITYMRTDSTNVAELAQEEARRYISQTYVMLICLKDPLNTRQKPRVPRRRMKQSVLPLSCVSQKKLEIF